MSKDTRWYADFGYGYWQRGTKEQLEAVAEFCHGRYLLDIGGYNGSLADYLLRKGASAAYVIEKEDVTVKKLTDPRISRFRKTFKEFEGMLLDMPFAETEVALLSWPVNSDTQMYCLISILRRCQFVVYLGKNDNGTQCGTPTLWDYLVTRKIHLHYPCKEQVLLIYGPEDRPCEQERTDEEIAGANVHLSWL